MKTKAQTRRLLATVVIVTVVGTLSCENKTRRREGSPVMMFRPIGESSSRHVPSGIGCIIDRGGVCKFFQFAPKLNLREQKYQRPRGTQNELVVSCSGLLSSSRGYFAQCSGLEPNWGGEDVCWGSEYILKTIQPRKNINRKGERMM